MTQQKRRQFTPEDYKRLARNPFVDKKMLQFVKNKTVGSVAGQVPAGTTAALSTDKAGSVVSHVQRSRRDPVMSEKTAMLIAMAIKGMLRE